MTSRTHTKSQSQTKKLTHISSGVKTVTTEVIIQSKILTENQILTEGQIMMAGQDQALSTIHEGDDVIFDDLEQEIKFF